MDLDDDELRATRRMNGSDKNVACMEEDIKILENLLEEGFEAMCYLEAQAIEHLIKAYKELEEENMQLEAIKDEAIRRYNFETIPVSLVEEKIEELKEDIKKGKTRYPYILEHKIEVLQELLERRK